MFECRGGDMRRIVLNYVTDYTGPYTGFTTTNLSEVDRDASGGRNTARSFVCKWHRVVVLLHDATRTGQS